MSLRRLLATGLFGAVINDIVQERMKAAAVTDKDETGWRKLTGDSNRNLSPLKQERMIEISYWLWENNPMAFWLIEIMKDFILAEGLPYEANNEKVKEVLDDFWYDPLNRMDLYADKNVRELFLYGELCLPAFIAQQTGKVRLGYIDPLNIKEVVTDPENVKAVIGIILKSKGGEKERQIRTILPQGADDILSPKAKQMREGYADGECFYYAINNVTNSPRGRSELLTVADWLDAYEQFLFDYADKWPLLNSFVWDLTVEDGDDKSIAKHMEQFTKKSGSVFGHNQKVTLKDVTPQLGAHEADKGARLFRNHILGSKSVPEHWYGGAGDVNLATAIEMGTPTFKSMSSKQRYVKYIFEDIFSFVIEQRRKARTLTVSDDEAGDYSVITPELATKDVSKYSTAIQQIAASLAVAQTQKWIDEKTARQIFAGIVGYLGIEVDVEQVEEEVEEKKEKEGYEDYE